ncbi:MAG TPA: DNA-3-methyladenine glycosylase I [Bacteroidales bacterium]|nr:DNA-3-methyladenine glycosylase I [Bacteroidales bacterium]
MNQINRCDWADAHPLLRHYHDTEWGVPLHDDTKLFEFLVLDAFQAGLSWLTVLKKREAFREAFDNFNPGSIACYGEEKVEMLMQNPDIIRNRLKIKGTIRNAQAFLSIRQTCGSFDQYIWQFTGHKTIVNVFYRQKDLPARSPESDAMSKALRKDGFTFVGSTICYAFMQAAGMVNDHLTTCFRHGEILSR